jgi:hypothetical protein
MVHKRRQIKMIIDTIHHQDVRAALRKRFGTISSFEQMKKLARGSVHEVLRGRPSDRTRREIESVLIELGYTSSEHNEQPQNRRAAA